MFVKYCRNRRVAAASIGCEKALLNVQTGKYLYLNETAARIWELLENGQTVGELTEALCAEYEIEQDAATAKILIFLQKAVAAGVVLESDGVKHVE